MLIRIVAMTFQKEKTADFLSIFNANHNKIRSFKGCHSLKLVRDIDHNEIFFTISHWESAEALKAYRNSDLFLTTWKRTRLLFSKAPKAWSTEMLVSDS